MPADRRRPLDTPSAVAIRAIAAYPITEEFPHEVRTKFERRRGAPGDAVPAA